MKKKYLFLMFIGLLLVSLASALQIPENILKAGQETLSTATKVSLIVAFIGGILGFFTPCTIGILPAYFAYSFETRKELVKATFFFFLGMATVTVPIGFLMAAAGSYFRRPTLALTAGVILLLLGIMLVLGKGFKLINVKNTAKRNNLGVYIFGLLFAVGFTPCSGPILASIIVLSSVTTKLYAALMFVVYSLGTTLPLFILSLFFEKYNIAQSKIFTKGSLNFSLFGRSFETHWTKIVGGIMFIFLGIIFIIYRDTEIFIVSLARIGYPLDAFYELQNKLINSTALQLFFGLIIFIIALLFFYYYKKRKNVLVK